MKPNATKKIMLLRLNCNFVSAKERQQPFKIASNVIVTVFMQSGKMLLKLYIRSFTSFIQDFNKSAQNFCFFGILTDSCATRTNEQEISVQHLTFLFSKFAITSNFQNHLYLIERPNTSSFMLEQPRHHSKPKTPA
jgi:hypothetical protein